MVFFFTLFNDMVTSGISVASPSYESTCWRDWIKCSCNIVSDRKFGMPYDSWKHGDIYRSKGSLFHAQVHSELKVVEVLLGSSFSCGQIMEMSWISIIDNRGRVNIH